ncbi:protein RRNAD1-like isoform X2 [Aricia agestis]|nr:protein RRNAD1-like isoform X2 [Aricia agestis]
MTLPASFASASEYFEEVLTFLSEYQHLYKFPNTDILIENVLDEIPASSDDLDVYDDLFDLRNVTDEYFTNIFPKLDRLTPNCQDFTADDRLELVIDVPLSLKKKHEIVYLANELSNVCEQTRCNTIVDFGSGLGYLDQQLFATTHCQILGLECNENHYVEAKKRQRKYHSESTEKVKYIKHTVTEDSVPSLEELIRSKFPNTDNFCITGLHACADLSVDAMNIFLRMPRARSLVIMPCCYHRLESRDGTFKNFPVSECLKAVYTELGGSGFLRVPFLRLATQPQVITTSNIRDLVFNLLARAVLQLYGHKRNCKLKRRKRKGVRVRSVENDFEMYVQHVAAGFSLVPADADHASSADAELEFSTDELISMWSEISYIYTKRAAIFILLQNYLQPMFENVVLYDRLCYLRENGVESMYKRILNNSISPRCLCLIAFKNNKQLQ